MFLCAWRLPTAARRLSSSACLNLDEERDGTQKRGAFNTAPYAVTREKTTISPLVSSSSSTTLLMSLNSDRSWIFILENKIY